MYLVMCHVFFLMAMQPQGTSDLPLQISLMPDTYISDISHDKEGYQLDSSCVY